MCGLYPRQTVLRPCSSSGSKVTDARIVGISFMKPNETVEKVGNRSSFKAQQFFCEFLDPYSTSRLRFARRSWGNFSYRPKCAITSKIIVRHIASYWKQLLAGTFSTISTSCISREQSAQRFALAATQNTPPVATSNDATCRCELTCVKRALRRDVTVLPFHEGAGSERLENAVASDDSNVIGSG